MEFCCYHCEWHLRECFKSMYLKSETLSLLIWNYKITVPWNAHSAENNTTSNGEFTDIHKQ